MIPTEKTLESKNELQKLNLNLSAKCNTADINTCKENFILKLDEKFKLAIEKEPKINSLCENNNLSYDIAEADTKRCTEANITTESQLEDKKITSHGEEELVILFQKDQAKEIKGKSSKKEKIFKIKKYVKYNKFLQEICSDEEISENEKKVYAEPQSKKISPVSKVNFSKLSPEEKDDRLKNIAKLVKRLRRKVRTLENKVRFNATKLLNKHICNKLGINTKNKYVLPEFHFDFEKVVKCLKKIRNFEEFEYDDQKHLIENIINLISEDKLKVDSLKYKKICSIIRMLIPKEKIKYISKKDSKITVAFPETEVYITNKEYLKLAKYKDNEDIMRTALGVYDQTKEKVIKITTEEPCKNVNESIKYLCNLNNFNNNQSYNNNIPNQKEDDNLNLPNYLFNNSNSLNTNNNMNNLLGTIPNSFNFNSNSSKNEVSIPTMNMSIPLNNASAFQNFNPVLANALLQHKSLNSVDINQFSNMNNLNNINLMNYGNDPSNQLKLWLLNNKNNNSNLQQFMLNCYPNIYNNAANLTDNKQSGNMLNQHIKNDNQSVGMGFMYPNILNPFSNTSSNANSNQNQNAGEKNFILK